VLGIRSHSLLVK